MQKYVFVINPVAGKGKALKLETKIKQECEKRKLYYEII